MQTMWKTRILAIALLTGSALSVQATETGNEFLFERPSFAVAPDQEPVVARAGELALANGQTVPLYSLTMPSAGQDDMETFEPKTHTLDKRIKPELARRLVAYAYPMGIILVPRDWTPRSARIGADGSMVMLFAPDNSGRSYVLFNHAGACMGCAISNASLYFPEARTMAEQSNFEFYRPSGEVHAIRLSRFEQAYSIKVNGGNPVDGLAHFDPDDDFPYYDVQISVAKSEHALATVILNQFVVPKHPKRQ